MASRKPQWTNSGRGRPNPHYKLHSVAYHGARDSRCSTRNISRPSWFCEFTWNRLFVTQSLRPHNDTIISRFPSMPSPGPLLQLIIVQLTNDGILPKSHSGLRHWTSCRLKFRQNGSNYDVKLLFQLLFCLPASCCSSANGPDCSTEVGRSRNWWWCSETVRGRFSPHSIQQCLALGPVWFIFDFKMRPLDTRCAKRQRFDFLGRLFRSLPDWR